MVNNLHRCDQQLLNNVHLKSQYIHWSIQHTVPPLLPCRHIPINHTSWAHPRRKVTFDLGGSNDSLSYHQHFFFIHFIFKCSPQILICIKPGADFDLCAVCLYKHCSIPRDHSMLRARVGGYRLCRKNVWWEGEHVVECSTWQ